MSRPSHPSNEVDARIAVAHVTLAVHRPNDESGRCSACGRYCPCDEANRAANTLAAYGLPVVDNRAPGSRLRDPRSANSPRSWGAATRLSAARNRP
jgi:hypothetical protein